MKKKTKLAALVSAAALTVSACPFSITADAAESYSVRDPFFNFRSDYHYYETEHFQFIWGNSGDASKVTDEFLTQNGRNFEACWDVYMNTLMNEPPSQSVEDYLRDGKEYKTNIYISGTGLEGMQDDWAYMSWDSGGFAYMFCCVDSMQYNPPSWVFPHEFGHVMTAHQRGWNNNKYSYAWWEAMGNWYREQYLYSDYSTDDTGHGTDFFETYMKNLCFTFPCGRDYYASWAFLQYLTENPDNLDGYGADFVKKMLQEGQVDEYPFEQVERLAPADLKETLGLYAARMAGLDFKHGDAYRARLNELLSQGDWNYQQIYTMLEPVAGTNEYKVPTERAPQFAGINIIPLEAVSHSNYTVTLNPKTDIQGADWRACVVQQFNDGSCRYSQLFKAGETVEIASQAGSQEYLAVIATPDLDSITKYGLPGIYDDNSMFSESNYPFMNKERYPYSVTLSDNVTIKERTVSAQNQWGRAEYKQHPFGGGLVASTAHVDDSVYVAPNAIVKDSAEITGNVKILDHAVVEGSAKVSDNAVISGYGIVAENAVVSGNARVSDTAMVMGKANISGNAKIIESACVYGNTKMTDNAVAKGIAFVMADAVISGQGVVDGDYYDDSGKNITKGTSFGWTSAQSYSDSRPYTDNLIYAYDFGDDSSLSFNDRYNSTYGIISGAKWESERTSANGVLTFSGDSFADMDSSILYTDKIEIQTAFLDRNTNNTGEVLLFLGDDLSHIKISIENNNVMAQASYAEDSNSHMIVFENAAEKGVWKKLELSLDGENMKLSVDGETKQIPCTVNPSDIAERINADSRSAAYRIGADNNGNSNFNGSVDFVRIFNDDAPSPEEVYTQKEDIQTEITTTTTTEFISETTTTTADISDDVLYGDANLDGKVSISDAVRILQYVANVTKYDLSNKAKNNADVNERGNGVTAKDAAAIQKFDAGVIDKLPES